MKLSIIIAIIILLNLLEAYRPMTKQPANSTGVTRAQSTWNLID